ncbi:hypothetical protein GCM10023183_14450 [Nibribacter koreensis]|uniref:Uncharacterized protein n=1 Tax=Nibribacter koreensis TaxID=1084519 RepID=A0ABP8FG39_9BACT
MAKVIIAREAVWVVGENTNNGVSWSYATTTTTTTTTTATDGSIDHAYAR